MNRRQFLHRTGLVSAAAVLGSLPEAQAAPKPEILNTRVISHQPQLYHGWPTLARLHPFGIDVSSGVERTAGIKDPEKMSRLVAAVRGFDGNNEH